MAVYLTDPKKLRICCAEILEKAGVPQQDALLLSDTLVEADITGVESHGTTRLGIYIKKIKGGSFNPICKIETVEEKEGMLAVDAHNSLGAVTTERLMKIGMEKAKKTGVCAITVKNAAHFGAAGYYTRRAAREHQMIMFLCANGPAAIAPWGSYKPYHGTNPFSLSLPTYSDPVVLDMATCIAARGKIILSNRKGEPIPPGWALSADGKPTTDAAEALKGCVLPFGGAKGYGIALAIDVLSGILAGAAFGNHIKDFFDTSEPMGLGHFMAFLDPSAFVPMDRFLKLMEQMTSEIKSFPTIEGVEKLYLPGGPEFEKMAERSKEGFTMPEVVYNEIKALCQQYDVIFDIDM